MPKQTVQNIVNRFVSESDTIDDITEVINIENPTPKQLYFFKTMLGWAEANDITPRNLHVDGTIEGQNGDEHNSPIDQVPVESKEQLIVLADHNGNLDKILYSKKGDANGRSIVNDLSAMEAIEISDTTNISKTIQPHLTDK